MSRANSSRAGPCGVAVRGCGPRRRRRRTPAAPAWRCRSGRRRAPGRRAPSRPTGARRGTPRSGRAGWRRSRGPRRPRSLDHAAGQQVQALLAGPACRVLAARAVPDAVGEPGTVRLDVVGELLDALGPRERAGRVAAEQPHEAEDALVGEVLGVAGVGIERRADVVEARRRTDAHPGVHATTGQDVDGGEVLGQAERVLPAQRGDRRPELDARGALGGRRHDRDRGGHPELQVPVA